MFFAAILFLPFPVLPEVPDTTSHGDLTIVWWNVENMFDTVDDPEANGEFGSDDEFTPNGNLSWTNERYERKLGNIANVIRAIRQEYGLTILGLCEVEHEHVLRDMISRHFADDRLGVAYHESPDSRGIDVAFIYDSTAVKPRSQSFRRIPLEPRPTRDIVFVEFESAHGRLLCIGNHWPSRSGGQEQSEPHRILAAKTARALIDSVFHVDPRARVVMMGDFNDEPDDPSVNKHLRASSDREDALMKGDVLFNCVALQSRGDSVGSYLYRGSWEMIDQFMLSPGLLDGALAFRDAFVYKRDHLLEPSGEYKGSPFRTYGGRKYLGGYSDHLPLILRLRPPGH